MSSDTLLAILQVVLQLLGAASSSSSYEAIIDLIVKLLPALVNAEQYIVQAFQNVIADLSGSPNLTAAQVQTMLQAKATLDARVDADIAATLGTAATGAS